MADQPEPKVRKSEKEWRAILTEHQFLVTREGQTEPEFEGTYWDFFEVGVYHCVCCLVPLFSSETKFPATSGWPSFWQPISADRIYLHQMQPGDDPQVTCRRCGAHLGHAHNDGPPPTGMRYSVNSAALRFVPENVPNGT